MSASTAVAAAPAPTSSVEDDQPLTSRTHDGTMNHDNPALARTQPISSAQSVYTPTPAPAATSPEKKEEVKEETVTVVSSSQTNSSSQLASTQLLVPHPPSQPSHSRNPSQGNQSQNASSRPRSSTGTPVPATGKPGKLVPLAEPSEASKLPFYDQVLAMPAQSTVAPLPANHMSQLPLSAIRAHISRANAEALELMKVKEYQMAFDRLKRAEHFCQHHTIKHDRSKVSIVLRASTYNNLSILYKSVHQLRRSLFYANRALRLEINAPPPPPAHPNERGVMVQETKPNPAGTHLNMCAILSSMGRHSSALLHAECALSCLYLELHHMTQQSKRIHAAEAAYQQGGHHHGSHKRGKSISNTSEAEGDSSAASASGSNTPAFDKASLLALVAVAYHNMAVEQEFLHQYRASTHSYRRAAEFSRKRLGENHMMSRTIAWAYEGAVNLHPLRVIAPDQSLDPLVKPTVSNTAATTNGASALNKWLIPSLENNPMIARHIPVRFTPFNQFVAVSGLTLKGGNGRGSSASGKPPASAPSGQQGARGRKGRFASNQGSFDEKESASAATAAPFYFAGDSQGDELLDLSGNGGGSGGMMGDEDNFGPELTEALLRARNAEAKRMIMAQKQQQQQHPNHPPPPIPLNVEEGNLPVGTIGGNKSHDSHNPHDPESEYIATDAGYWSDPEVGGELSATGGGGGANGSGAGPSRGLRTKFKQDPRLGPIKSVKNSSSAGSLPSSAGGNGGKPLPMRWQQHQQQVMMSQFSGPHSQHQQSPIQHHYTIQQFHHTQQQPLPPHPHQQQQIVYMQQQQQLPAGFEYANTPYGYQPGGFPHDPYAAPYPSAYFTQPQQSIPTGGAQQQQYPQPFPASPALYSQSLQAGGFYPPQQQQSYAYQPYAGGQSHR